MTDWTFQNRSLRSRPIPVESGDHAVELGRGRQPVGHQVLRLIALPVRGLLVDDLDGSHKDSVCGNTAITTKVGAFYDWITQQKSILTSELK